MLAARLETALLAVERLTVPATCNARLVAAIGEPAFCAMPPPLVLKATVLPVEMPEPAISMLPVLDKLTLPLAAPLLALTDNWAATSANWISPL